MGPRAPKLAKQEACLRLWRLTVSPVSGYGGHRVTAVCIITNLPDPLFASKGFHSASRRNYGIAISMNVYIPLNRLPFPEDTSLVSSILAGIPTILFLVEENTTEFGTFTPDLCTIHVATHPITCCHTPYVCCHSIVLFSYAMIQPHQPPPPPCTAQSSKASSKWIWWHDSGLKHAILESVRGRPRQSRMQVWLIRLSTSILLWTCLIQLMALGELWHPHLFKGWPPCFDKRHTALVDTPSSTPNSLLSSKLSALPLPRIYKSNGYLLVSCNGGLNQMRAAICDMVAISRYLNLTMVIPELDKTSFWADPSDFNDIFDVKHFIVSLRDEVRIVKSLPQKYHEKVRKGEVLSMPPVSWSNESYYLNQILPLIKKHKVIHFSKTDTRLANNGLPVWMQKLRCRVNYEALKFTPLIERLGQNLVNILQIKDRFLVLHLRYEMDMLAFSGCTHGCTDAEADQLTQMRFAYPWWKEKIIDSTQKRLDGLCPLTPEETVLVLKALGFHRDTQIYIAAGEIFGSKRRMASLHAAYPNILRKEMLLSQEELKHFQNHSSQMAALDYLVAIKSDVFIPTYDGNMAKVVSGHRRYLGNRKTILLDRRKLVGLLDQYKNGTLDWMLFSSSVQEVQNNHPGAWVRRKVIFERPKEEEYFYANPEECLA